MITRLHIENFKSLVDFRMPTAEAESLAPFTVLVGLNGSGKSTLLQAFEFIGQLVAGNVNQWLHDRGWQAKELLSAAPLRKSRTIRISLEWLDRNYGMIAWSLRYNPALGRSTHETIKLLENGKLLLELKDHQLKTAGADFQLITKFEKMDFVYEGSLLSLLTLADVHPAAAALKNGLVGLKSLELLSPHLMRSRAKTADDLGRGGEKLAAFLSTLDSAALEGLNERLRAFYPHFQDISVKSLKAGWKDLRVSEDYGPGSEFGAAHLSDGMLRMVGVLAQAHARHSVVLFDEIENGVNQQIVEMLMDFLLELSRERQVLVTTHSPLILNYLPDDKAREGVVFLYKDSRGATHAKRFFDLKQVAWKLKALGPGEVFVDTDLTVLSANLAKNEGSAA